MAHRRPGEVRVAVLTLDEARADEVVDVLCEAFFDYPVMRFVLGPNEPDYERGVRSLVNLFVMARVMRRETLLGIEGEGTLAAAAIVSRPGSGRAPEAFRTLVEEVWETLGAPARARYEAFTKACAPFQTEAPHLHLNMIGVRRAFQGRGLGRALIDHVHAMSLRDGESIGVTLTTEDADNVPMYRHLGYDVVGHATVAPDLRTWGFFRPNEAAAAR